jgi:LysR family transcriptional regulator, glycine cleavage system transcriptional activator
MTGPLPLLGLRAFVEAGRGLSMQAAARRLGVTPGAVSQQIKLLEARLGVTLFERGNRSVRLTRAGGELLAGVGEAFRQIEDALGAIERGHGRERSSLAVSTTGAFAASWLVPRLGGFTGRHKEIAVEILTTPDLVRVGAGAGTADLAIRHGLGDWTGVSATRLLQPRLLPVGSPGLLAKGPPVTQPGDCLRYPLLHDPESADWRLWLKAMGVADTTLRGTRFADSTLLARAAIAGQGLALLRDTYVMDEIAAGRLQVALDAPWPAQFAYYVVTARGPRSPAVKAFSDWLMAEAAEEG